jgi:hypothetical protein
MLAVRAVVFCVLTSAVCAQAAVHVVAPVAGPGVDFTSISAAIAASADGDTVLVRTGSYSAFGVNGQSLAITAEEGGEVVVAGGVFVIGVPAGGFVSLHGLSVQADEFSAALSLLNNAGHVWVESCTLRGCHQEIFSTFLLGTQALLVDHSDSVAVTGCFLQGGSGVAGEPAASCVSSNVHLYGSTLIGGAAHCEDPPSQHCGDAGPGLLVWGGFATAQSSSLVGGAAAPGLSGCPGCQCSQVGQGGVAVELSTGSPTLHFYDVALVPGSATPPCGTTGADVAGALNGVLEQSFGGKFELSVGSPVNEGALTKLSVEGRPGDMAFVLFSLLPEDTWIATQNGTLLCSMPFVLVALGQLSAAGKLSISVEIPELPAGYEGLPIVLQGLRWSESEGPMLANPLRPVLLQAGI